MLWALCISTFLFRAEAKAAVSGDIPCVDGGQVSWTLDENGVLTFSGNGTTKIGEKYTSNGWYSYWQSVGLVKTDVLSVKVDPNSEIHLDTGSSMFRQFKNCTAIDLTGFKTENMTSTNRMFEECLNLTNLNLSSLNTQNVVNMSSMFLRCKCLNELDVSNFNTENVTTMASMFSHCSALKQLNVENFDTAEVRDFFYMFGDCTSLEILVLGDFNTKQVYDMRGMFSNCKSLTQVDISSFDTSRVQMMDGMFSGCEKLTEVDLSNFNLTNARSLSDMFYGCTSLRTVNLSGLFTNNIRDITRMFYGCKSLTEIDLSTWDVRLLDNTDYMLGENDALQRFFTPKIACELTLPNIKNKCWMDTENNVYEAKTHIFLQSTELILVDRSYNINYVAEGELLNCPAKYNADEGLYQLGTVQYPHMSFAGWYLDEAYTVPVSAIEKGTVGDITLYGKLVPKINHITYMNADGILNSSEFPTQYTYGEEVTIAIPQKYCSTFLGWFWDEANMQPFEGITERMDEDVILYAKWNEEHDMDREHGQVLKAATEQEAGMIQYSCKKCPYTLTEEIPKLEKQPDTSEKQDNQEKPDTPENKDNPNTEIQSDKTEQAILKNGDKDIKGSSFSLIQARADKTTKNSICLKWNKVKGADGYFVYGNKCGKKNPYELIKTIDNGNTTSFTHTKINKGTYYKYTVYAYKLVNNKREKVAVSKTIHVTTKGNKYGNPQSVKVNKTKVILKKNKTLKLKCTQVAEKGKKISKHRAVCYESSNPQIATVTKKGVIKAKKKGTCYVYAYAQDGVYKKIKVTVK